MIDVLTQKIATWFSPSGRGSIVATPDSDYATSATPAFHSSTRLCATRMPLPGRPVCPADWCGCHVQVPGDVRDGRRLLGSLPAAAHRPGAPTQSMRPFDSSEPDGVSLQGLNELLFGEDGSGSATPLDRNIQGNPCAAPRDAPARSCIW